MEILLLVKAAVMGIVEGLTEFLPISSTGHLILTGSLLGFTDEKSKVFDIAIQTGAIFAVMWVYWQRLRETAAGLGHSAKAQRFTLNVAIAFVPAVVLGLLFGKAIKAHLFTPVVVASTFILGGLVILWAERRASTAVRIAGVDDMSPLDALKVGLVQCLAMVPGTSRSGATIIGGMLLGLSRRAATEFSFYLAMPTLIGAGVYSLYKERALLSVADRRCSRSAWCSRSSRPGCACAGCCATSRPTTSCPSPGTASRSASSCCSPPGAAGWSGPIERPVHTRRNTRSHTP